MPDVAASSTAKCREGLLRMGIMTLGTESVDGKNLVPNPAIGITALVTLILLLKLLLRLKGYSLTKI